MEKPLNVIRVLSIVYDTAKKASIQMLLEIN